MIFMITSVFQPQSSTNVMYVSKEMFKKIYKETQKSKTGNFFSIIFLKFLIVFPELIQKFSENLLEVSSKFT